MLPESSTRVRTELSHQDRIPLVASHMGLCYANSMTKLLRSHTLAMEAVGIYPPRWRVSEFASDRQLNAVGNIVG